MCNECIQQRNRLWRRLKRQIITELGPKIIICAKLLILCQKIVWCGNKPWESSKWMVLQIVINFGGCPWRIHGENRFFMHFSLLFFGRRATISAHIYQGTLNELVKSLLNSFKQLWFSNIVKRELQGMVSR